MSLRDLEEGKQLVDVTPFFRVVKTDDNVAKKLSCGPSHVAQLITLDLDQEKTLSNA